MRDTGSKIAYSVVIDGPDTEPVGRDTIVDLQLKVDSDFSVDDNLIDLKISAARQEVERVTGLSLITQTRRIDLDYFPYDGTLWLTNGPVQYDSVQVKYRDQDDAEQTLDPSDYWVDTTSRIARIVVKDSWPTTKCRPGAVTVTYDAGFGDEASDVPAALREAVLAAVGWMYSNRDQVIPPELIYTMVSSYIVVQDVSY